MSAIHSQRDVLIVGGGPAGLTAAIYCARFHLSVTLVDSGHSRAAMIPLTRNHAGFPEGISGPDLLDLMRRQAARYGVTFEQGHVTDLARQNDAIVAQAERGTIAARAVLLATGVVNHRPAMLDEAAHAAALASGRLRYCPICDGYEVTDSRVAVLGTGPHGCHEAVFLRSYTADVTLVAPAGGHDLDSRQRAELAAAGIVVAGACDAITLRDDAIVLQVAGQQLAFDSLYPALGSDTRSELAAALGATRSDEGCLIVDAHQRTDVAGLYAAGDVVLGLDQISHAMGEGGVAATTIRNDLAKSAPLRR
jgi:thioredoxin reductase (NADPH)